MEIRSTLPEHPVPERFRGSSTDRVLRIDGLVEQPLMLEPNALTQLPCECVDHLEVTSETGINSAQTIARGRTRSV